MCVDFYNYFQYGMDVLLSGTTHAVKKIILHSNIVSYYSSGSPPSLDPRSNGTSPGLSCSSDTSDVHGRLLAQHKLMVRHHFLRIIPGEASDTLMDEAPRISALGDKVWR